MEIQNYTLLQQQEIPEYHATGYVFRHEATGAQIVYLHAPEDDNKVFSISFCTPPQNDKGIPHILEHCVLNGSRKFPLKEPFVELLKGSLNTFLNAITFPDKTMFPVASRNEQDFMNLMDVYLDAVLHPNLLQDPFILKQEGWHYELENEDGEIQYKGVVYNEMKGSYSSGETILSRTAEKALFPDSIYGYSSGGDPDAIPDLSYEEFKQFHQTYYHPANSYIFFYGNGDIARHLQFLDEAYLQEFTSKAGRRVQIQPQKALPAPVRVESTYALAEGEGAGSERDKTFLSYQVVINTPLDAVGYYGFDMLAQILGGSESSPLKTALLKAGIGKDVYATVDLSALQPVFSVVARSANPEQANDFKRIVQETLVRVTKDGIDPKLLEATLSSTEFALREASYGMPKGLVLNMVCLDSWLYDRDPLQLLSYENAIRTIRGSQRFFESLIQNYLLDQPHSALVVLKPEAGLNQRHDQKIREKLAAYKASLTPEEVTALVEDTRQLQRRQQTPDAPEDLEKLPLLRKEDINPLQEQYIAQKQTVSGRPAMVYHDFTNQIAYVSLYFTMDYVKEEDLPYAGLLAFVLGMMDTEHYTYEALDNEIGAHMGGLNTDIRLLERLDGNFTPYFYIAGKHLVKESEAAQHLMREVLLHTKFNHRGRLKEVIAQTRLQLEKSMERRGDAVAANRALSYFDAALAYQERVSGVDFLLFLQRLEENFDDRAEETIERLEAVLAAIVSKDHLTVRMTCQQQEEEEITRQLEKVIAELPEKASHCAKQRVRVQPVAKNEGLITSGKVQYVAKAGRYTRPYEGAMVVMGHILSLDYLWNQVRVQGGAYGCFQGIDRQGRIHMESFRDPNLEKTLQVYEQAGEVLQRFDCTEREMTKYIIGAIAGLDPVRSVAAKGSIACDRLERGMTPAMLQTLRDEVLQTTPAQIRDCAKALTEAMQQPYLCVVGSEEKIRESADRFDTLVTLF